MTYLNQFCGSSQAFRLYMYMWPSWIEIKYNSIVYSSLAFKMIASVLRAGFVFVWEGRGSYNSVEMAGLVQLLWEGRGLYNFCGKGGAHTTLWKWPGLYNFCGKGGAHTTSVGRAGLVQLLWEGRGSYNFCGKGGARTTFVGRAGLVQLLWEGRGSCTLQWYIRFLKRIWAMPLWQFIFLPTHKSKGRKVKARNIQTNCKREKRHSTACRKACT